MTIIPKEIYKFNTIPVKLPMAFFHRIRTKILNLYRIMKGRLAKAILRKKSGAGVIRLPDFRPYFNATVIKTVWYWHKSRYIDQ